MIEKIIQNSDGTFSALKGETVIFKGNILEVYAFIKLSYLITP